MQAIQAKVGIRGLFDLTRWSTAQIKRTAKKVDTSRAECAPEDKRMLSDLIKQRAIARGGTADGAFALLDRRIAAFRRECVSDLTKALEFGQLIGYEQFRLPDSLSSSISVLPAASTSSSAGGMAPPLRRGQGENQASLVPEQLHVKSVAATHHRPSTMLDGSCIRISSAVSTPSAAAFPNGMEDAIEEGEEEESTEEETEEQEEIQVQAQLAPRSPPTALRGTFD